MKITHTIVETPNVFALIPLFIHGDTEDKPRPVPNINRISDKAAAAAAPAKMAPHATALAWTCRGSDSTPGDKRSIAKSLDIDYLCAGHW